jgi:pimeloyl-ACP methyl ester carboxylesterase
MERPDTCYVDSGGASIAYQEFGSGAIELAFVMFDAASHLEVLWEEPRVARIFERLGRFARVVMFDRRGTGLSDPAGDALTLEQQTDDLFAVLDAVGFERPAFVGASASAGRLAVFAAATHPERVSALVLIGSSVTGSRYWDPDRVEKFERLIASVWGTGRYAVMYVPSLADDARFLRWLGRFERNALSPGDGEAPAAPFGGDGPQRPAGVGPSADTRHPPARRHVGPDRAWQGAGRWHQRRAPGRA